MQPWGSQSLRLVTNLELREALEDVKGKDEIAELSMVIHKSMSERGATQRTFIDLLKTYRQIYAKKVKS
jgi:hypothetical protein